MSTSVPGEAGGDAPRRDVTDAFSIILALSFSHFLNDMIQSLVPALYPMLKGVVRPQLCPDRADHADHAGRLLGAAAGDRASLPIIAHSLIRWRSAWGSR